MKVVFFGLGSIGQRHLRILREAGHFQCFAFRRGRRRPFHLPGIKNIYSWQELDKIKPQVAFITNPTFLHIKTAMACARRGMALFIEKPLDCSIVHLETLLKLAAQRKITTYVAYCLRFHPVIQEFKKLLNRRALLHMRILTTSYLPLWRPKIHHLESYSARQNMGGGVIYDLSHELDFLEYLLGHIQCLKGNFGKKSDVTVDAEDYADILAQTKKGPVNIHLNFLSHHHQRRIQMDFKDRSVDGDLMKGEVSVYQKGKLVSQKRYAGTLEHCYERQIKYFFENIHNPHMMNNVKEAAELFKKIYYFKKTKGGHE